MKNKFAFLSFFFMLLSGILYAQDKNSNTLLWKVSGKNLKQPSYVFGTFHMMCKDQYQLKPKVKNALEKTQNFVMEIDYSNPKELVEMQKLLISDNKITADFTEEERATFSSNLEKFGYKLEELESFSPIALYSMLYTKFLKCDVNELIMIDLELMQLALKNGKTISGLETSAEQVEIFQKYFGKKEILKLVSDYEKGMEEASVLASLYTNEDLGKMYEMMINQESMNQDQKELLLDRRNEAWITKMPKIMEQKSTFFAFGAGHLLGEQGILNLLRNNGFTVTPVID